MRTLKPKNIVEQKGENPFKVALEVKVNELLFKDQYKKEGDLLLPILAEVEYDPFAKLYTTAELRRITNQLPSASKELLLWLMYEIHHGDDYIWINKERYMQECNVSLNTYKKAIDGLVRVLYLAFSLVKDVYHINPMFFFKGDRIKKYPNNVIKVS